jgi:multiple antibiotic resistance protein
MTYGHRFLLAFIPLFVAIDPIGVIPFYLSLTGALDAVTRRRVLLQAMATAFGVGVGFVLLGQAMFNYLDITTSDFRVAGGIILLVLSIYDLLFASESRKVEGANVGVVPLGIPLIVGPAVLTTLVLQADSGGMTTAILAFVVNLAIVLVVFLLARRILRLVGEGGMAAVSKIATLLLAAIAVMMIRRGITEIIAAAAGKA